MRLFLFPSLVAVVSGCFSLECLANLFQLKDASQVRRRRLERREQRHQQEQEQAQLKQYQRIRHRKLLDPGVLPIGVELLPNQYIVIFDLSVPVDVNAKALEYEAMGLVVVDLYDTPLFKGIALSGLDDDDLLNILNESDVELVEHDRLIEMDDQTSDALVQGFNDHDKGDVDEEGDLGWGLDRIDQRALPLDGIYDSTPGNEGAGVDIYVIDTGAQFDHEELLDRESGQSRCVCAANLIQAGMGVVDDLDCEDNNGHGTQVAGIAAGLIHGVAKNAQIQVVNVCYANGRCPASHIIKGLEICETANYRLDVGKEDQPTIPRVCSVSIGAGFSTAVNKAAESASLAGAVVVVAAGNQGDNACYQSPAGAASSNNGIITVGATNQRDGRSWFSNFGSCVTLYAPGEDVITAARNLVNNEATTTTSGTSFAAPYVTGAAALILQARPNMTPLQVKEAILSISSRSVISGLEGPETSNALLRVPPPSFYEQEDSAAEESVDENEAISAIPVMLINCGSKRDYTDPETGFTWLSDRFYSTGKTWRTTPDKMKGIYRTERYNKRKANGHEDLVYNIPVARDDVRYKISLHFAEIYHQEAGQRFFDVYMEDEIVLEGFDIYHESGGSYQPIVKTFERFISDGDLKIAFVGGEGNAKISAIGVFEIAS